MNAANVNILNSEKRIFIAFFLTFSLIGTFEFCSTSPKDEKVKAPEKSYQLANFEINQLNKPIFKINIDRKLKNDSCTQGYLIVNGEAMAYTLELPDKNNANYVSSIPKNTYSAKIRTDGDLGWRVELLDVPNRENIQLHIGNYTRQIKGCILIGTKVDLNKCNVLNSYRHEAMKKLQDKFNTFTRELILNQGIIKPIDIEVEISGI